MRERTGEIFQNKKTGKWIARVGYTNSRGKRTAVQKTAETKSEARKLLTKLLLTFEKSGADYFEYDKITFEDLSNYYRKQYVKPAKFIDDRKVEGMRNYKRVLGFLKQFDAYFGKMKLRRIDYDEIVAYRNYRLSVPTHYKKPRNIATMNREISCLRRVFNIAIRKGWLSRNPVNMGEPLIDKSAERRRTKILSLDEEKRLLDACTGRRKHLKPLIIILLDTGARLGETLKLKFEDLDFENRLITFKALNTKSLKSRRVAMTARIYEEFSTLWESSNKKKDSLVFRFKSVKRAFDVACNEAGIETGRPFGLTIHNLRHTAATRLIRGQMPIQFVGRILGHTQPQTTYRYLSADDEVLYTASKILESYHIQSAENPKNESDYLN
jgi:integrase